MSKEFKLVKAYYSDYSYCIMFDFGNDYLFNSSSENGAINKKDFKDIKPLEKRCTLTDAVEKYRIILQNKKTEQDLFLYNKEDVENFKKEHLYKEEKTLENGIYEAELYERKRIFYIENNCYRIIKDGSIVGDVSELHNPKKIADL